LVLVVCGIVSAFKLCGYTYSNKILVTPPSSTPRNTIKLANRTRYDFGPPLQATPRTPVYTFFARLTPGKLPSTDKELLELVEWTRNWFSRGHSPRILGPRDAKHHPRYEIYVAQVNTFPTVNNPLYEESCYVRWLALAVAGGGLFADYDILYLRRLPALENESHQMQSVENLVPMVFNGDRQAVENFIEIIFSNKVFDVEYGNAHTSDMHIAIRNSNRFVLLPGTDHLLHVSTHLMWSVVKDGSLKAETMNRVARTLFLATTRCFALAGPSFSPLAETLAAAVAPPDGQIPAWCFIDGQMRKECRHILPEGTTMLSPSTTIATPNDADDTTTNKDQHLFMLVVHEPVMRLHESFAKTNGLSFRDYIENPSNQNVLLAALAGEATEQALEWAKGFVASPRVFVGLDELPEATWLLLEYTVGCTLSRQNQSPAASEPVLPSSDLDRATELNRMDIELYSHIATVFHQRFQPVNETHTHLLDFLSQHSL